MDERDETLPDRLKAEWPGILAWAVEGAVEWGLQGLMPPEAVRSATHEYLLAEDAIALWIDECCHVGPEMSGTSGGLYSSWRKWCERAGETSGSQRTFGDALEASGYARRKGGKGRRVHQGIRPQPETSEAGYARVHE